MSSNSISLRKKGNPRASRKPQAIPPDGPCLPWKKGNCRNSRGHIFPEPWQAWLSSWFIEKFFLMSCVNMSRVFKKIQDERTCSIMIRGNWVPTTYFRNIWSGDYIGTALVFSLWKMPEAKWLLEISSRRDSVFANKGPSSINSFMCQ